METLPSWSMRLETSGSQNAPELYIIIVLPKDDYETRSRLLSSTKKPISDLDYHITVPDHDKILEHAITVPLPRSPPPGSESRHGYSLRARVPSTREELDSAMSDASPSKRRKTSRKTMKPKKSIQLVWPAELLPVEIFSLIVDYLPRSSIQNLRLVNKEFDRKVVEALFKVVVVPFRPEIYGIASDASANDNPQGSVMLQDKGMQVFQGFGQWIQKFAMSFEIDLDKLANPPVKCDQEAIVSFWGIYRWPYKTYNRYTQLEGLEQTADETRSMAKALRFISSAKELGLSIDGGLGWLAGPDINQRVEERGQALTVFGESRHVPEIAPNLTMKAPKPSKGPAQPGSMRAAFERMLQEAGYLGENLEPSIRMMLENEDAEDGIWTYQPYDNPPARSAGVENDHPSATGTENWRMLARRRRPLGHGARAPALNAIADDDESVDQPNINLFSEDEEEIDGELVPAMAFSVKAKAKADALTLKPNDLTNAQREMLLEMEWAQEAFMQSYVIAVIDNHVTFERIESLNIARLPSRYLAILRREDFWNSLPEVKKLALGVIPDWRNIVKDETTWVQDNRITPSSCIPGVFQLLSQHISSRENITSLHFEWLCGGEEAPGLFARNQLILAAPIVSESMQMVNRVQQYPILTLPHIKNLSLKNCWVSPHVMITFMSSLTKSALQSLTLDSVSLTASLALNAHPAPVTGPVHGAFAQNPQNAQNVAAHAAAQAGGNQNGQLGALHPQQVPAHPAMNVQGQPPAAPVLGGNWFNALAQLPPVPPSVNQHWLTSPPRNGSWADVINTLSPGDTLADLRHARNNNPFDEPPVREPTTLTKIELNSCGYVRLPLDFDQTLITPGQPNNAANLNASNLYAKRVNELEPHMLKPLESCLGEIVNYIQNSEVAILQNAWNLQTDWDNVSRRQMLADSRADGITNPGRGRISGLIEAHQQASPNAPRN